MCVVDVGVNVWEIKSLFIGYGRDNILVSFSLIYCLAWKERGHDHPEAP